MNNITLEMVDGVRIVAPDSLNLITPYVLREQQDWFEDEIKFLRRLLRPGERIIDIGANHGVYALSMAKAVGPAGRIWAFEPARQTFSLLTQSIATNAFTNVVCDRRALSRAEGLAQLSINENSELNALVRDPDGGSRTETVPITTLDACMAEFDWTDIAFVKIDAEGEESNILIGGKRFFAELSPLVQYEVRAGTAWNMTLVGQFESMEYRSYRLVPGLNLLVRYRAGETPDGYLLNLFCCKDDRANRLAEGGFLVADDGSFRAPTQPLRHGSVGVPGRGLRWQDTIGTLPYGALLARSWEQTMASGRGSKEVTEALSLYAQSRTPDVSARERYVALESSFGLFRRLCETQPAYLRLASLARIARDIGARTVAVDALQKLCNTILSRTPVDLGEPFLAPSARFDAIPPGRIAGDWVLAAALEEFERLAAYSSIYTGASARQRLEIIEKLGFGSAEMKRRLDLVTARFGSG